MPLSISEALALASVLLSAVSVVISFLVSGQARRIHRDHLAASIDIHSKLVEVSAIATALYRYQLSRPPPGEAVTEQETPEQWLERMRVQTRRPGR